MSVTFKPEVYALMIPVPKVIIKTEKVFAIIIPTKFVVRLKVLNQGQTISLPFYSTRKGLCAAIRWNEKDWFNKLVFPDDPNASAVCVLYNNVTYRLSLS